MGFLFARVVGTYIRSELSVTDSVGAYFNFDTLNTKIKS